MFKKEKVEKVLLEYIKDEVNQNQHLVQVWWNMTLMNSEFGILYFVKTKDKNEFHEIRVQYSKDKLICGTKEIKSENMLDDKFLKLFKMQLLWERGGSNKKYEMMLKQKQEENNSTWITSFRNKRNKKGTWNFMGSHDSFVSAKTSTECDMNPSNEYKIEEVQNLRYEIINDNINII